MESPETDPEKPCDHLVMSYLTEENSIFRGELSL